MHSPCAHGEAGCWGAGRVLRKSPHAHRKYPGDAPSSPRGCALARYESRCLRNSGGVLCWGALGAEEEALPVACRNNPDAARVPSKVSRPPRALTARMRGL